MKIFKIILELLIISKLFIAINNKHEKNGLYLIEPENKLLNTIIILFFLKNKYHFLEFNIYFLSIDTLIIIV